MLVNRLFGNLFASLKRTPRASRVRALIAQAERECSADPAVALAALEEASALEPDNARVHSLIAEIHIGAERYDLAREHLERATALGATAHGLTQLGNVYQVRGEPARAQTCYGRALELEPRAQLAHYNLAFLLRSQGRFAEALPHLIAAHESAPLSGAMLRVLVNALLEASRFDDALRISEAVTAADPSCVDGWLCLGLARQKVHASAQALACYERALALRDGDADLYNSRAVAFQHLGRWPEAFESYDKALALDPGHVLARFHRALALLANHRYGSGWPDYEARLLSVDAPRVPRSLPRWTGEPLGGRRLLVLGEQGLGDEIMFASCVPDVIAAGARCVVECAPPLERLFRRSFPTAEVRVPGRPGEPEGFSATDCDFYVPAGSLPLYYRRSIADFPRHRGYLRADPERIAAWSERLQGLGPGLKVGLSWRGGTHKTRSPLRSIELGSLAPILKLPGVVFVSLQYTPDAPAEIEALHATHGIEIVHWPEAIADYDETAALVTALDLTVTVCTAVAHLAGALGRPAWVMAPTGAEWRYGHAGQSMPWYPSVRLIRQRAEGDWSGVVDEVARRLSAFAAGETVSTVGDDAQMHNREGIAKLGAGDFKSAQQALERAIEVVPYLAQAHSNLGIALLEQGREVDGERELRAALELEPGLVSAQENLAVMLTARHDHDGAAAAWERVLAADPRHATGYAGKAFLAFREGRGEEARVLRERALELGADAAPIRMQEAAAAAMSGDSAAAGRLLDSVADAVDPFELQWERALCDLYDQRYESGWPLYEARLKRRSEASRRPYHYPQWDGQPLAAGALLILGEQGPGDEIMFASCYAEAIARAGRCVIECEPRLTRLFARSFPGTQVVGNPRATAHPELVGRADIVAQVYCGSLPRFFRLRAADFPRHRGYLAADARRTAAWRKRLSDESGRSLVGISWSGGLRHTWRSARSIGAQTFAQLLRIPDVDFVSLQHDDDGTAAAELARRSGARVHAVAEAFADFDELAALIASLDCVVTVCSTVVHLAGALGATTLVLAPKQVEWRYLLEGSSMPWYPSARLLRQARSEDWEPVIENARAALAEILESRGSDLS